ncbi:hypothetical protein [Loktanella sp. S4079]|uniref:hypothetical protein n=1 Tax=Loktanella sp. S4079 TaxID=579483 RepID=UPI0005F9C443|nr:hypothetical protein [Loktanella sp. S4079]KJZ20754.1 hypothetical protein TW80_08345 [Loktanella sp. S4079]
MPTDFDRYLDRAEERANAIQRWEQAAPQSTPMRQIMRGELLRAKPHSAVFAGTFRDQPIIARHVTRPNAAELVTKLGHELREVGPKMNDGDCRLNQLIDLDPTVGLLIVSKLPGEPLLLHSASDLYRHVGRWHHKYVGGRREQGKFSAQYWLSKLDQVPNNGLDGDDLALAAHFKSRLDNDGSALQGGKICRVAGHGDFAPHNFHFDGQTLYGFDTGVGAKTPLARDLAHLVFHVALKAENSSASPWGVAEQDVIDLAQAAELPSDELPSTLWFFYGWFLYRGLLRYAKNATRRERLRSLITTYLVIDRL